MDIAIIVVNRMIKINKKTSFILPLLIFFVLLILLLYQFNWFKMIKNLEIKRLTNEVVSCAKNTIVLLENEVAFFSDIVQFFVKEDEDLETQINTSIEYWNQNAIERKLIQDVFLIQEDDLTQILKVSNTNLVDITTEEKNKLIKSLYFPLFDRKNRDSVFYIPTNIDIDYIAFSLRHVGVDYFVVYSINKQILVSNTLPLLVRYCFNQSEDYYYRVFDLTNQQDLFVSCEDNLSSLFNKPDFVWDLYPEDNDWINKPYAKIKGKERILTDFSTFSNTSGLLRKELLKQSVSLDAIQPKWATKRHVLLQVVHKNGSLIKAAQKTTFINTIISLSIFSLLVICILMMYINMRKAQKLASKQKEFIATITHELKTPLTVISLAAQNMEAGIVKSTSNIDSYGKMIRKESDRLKRTIDYILMYSQISAYKKDNFKVVDINDIISEVIEKYKSIIEKECFTLEYEKIRESVLVFCDVFAIESVMQNLIDNAIKHAASGKYLKIEVQVNIQTNMVMVFFTDKGKGIPKKEQSRIFEVFERGDEALKNQIQGMGIGLNIAKRMMNSNGGSIKLSSSSLSGSVFAIQLPIYTAEIHSIS